jgi:signal transduction histidine kinase
MRRARPWLGALGLRGRIVGAVLVTTVATLAIAAVALLGPLEQSLKNADKKTLQTEVKAAAGTFQQLDLQYIGEAKLDPYPGPTGTPCKGITGKSAAALEQLASCKAELVNIAAGATELSTLVKEQDDAGARMGATVYLWGYFDQDGDGRILQDVHVEPLALASAADVTRAYMTHHAVQSFASINGTEYVREAYPFTQIDFKPHHLIVGGRYVLAVQRPIGEIPGAVKAVRQAFIYAALAGLALTLILGIPLSATLVRRLRRLRHAALQLAQRGPGVEVPVDRARDEVGDLARTFALMQHQLHQQEEARRAFVATASHELRTPLTSLEGMLELVDEDLASGEPDLDDARSLLNRARVQSRRLARLAADLLDLSRIDAQVQLRSEPVELGELSRAVMAEFELGTSQRGIVSELDDAAGPVWALGDPGSVARILRILLDNAVRVSPDGGQITVLLRNGEHAALTVCDKGPGVAEDERAVIFERFQRGRVTGGQAGFGLGLAIGRELAQRMGGELVLEQGDGGGAKFTLRLPVAHAPEEEPLMIG